MDEAMVRQLVADHLAVPVRQVVDQASFRRDLGADSLDLVELTMLLENALGIDIPADASERCATVADALHFLRLTSADCGSIPDLLANQGIRTVRPTTLPASRSSSAA